MSMKANMKNRRIIKGENMKIKKAIKEVKQINELLKQAHKNLHHSQYEPLLCACQKKIAKKLSSFGAKV